MMEINRENGDGKGTLKTPGEKKGAILQQEELIHSTLSQLMGQCRALMIQHLEKEARRETTARVRAKSQLLLNRALVKFTAVEEDIQTVILERVQARLSDLMRQETHLEQIQARLPDIIRKEVQVVAEDLLASTDELLDKPLGEPDTEDNKEDSPEHESSCAVGVDTEEVEPLAPSNLYEGRIELQVSPESALSSLTRLISSLRQMPNLRVESIFGSRHGGTSIWLQLLDTLPLMGILLETGEIAEVAAMTRSSGNGDLPLLRLRLKEGPSNGPCPGPSDA